MAALESAAPAGALLSFAATSSAQLQAAAAAGAAQHSLGAGFLAALDAVCSQGLAAVAALELLHRAQTDVRGEHVPRFWARLEQAQGAQGGEEGGGDAGTAAVEAALLAALEVGMAAAFAVPLHAV